MTSVLRSIEEGNESRVSIDADTPAELFAEVAMLLVRTAQGPASRARACARAANLPAIKCAEKLQALGYHHLSVRARAGRWHAEILLH